MNSDEQEDNEKLKAFEDKLKAYNKQKRYNEKFKRMVVAFVNDGNSYQDACDVFGVNSKGSIKKWLDDYGVDMLGDSEKDLLERYKNGIKIKNLRVADMCLDEMMNVDKIKEAKLRDLGVTQAVCVDKAMVLEKGDNSLFNINIAMNGVSKSTDEILSLEANEKRLLEELARFKGELVEGDIV